MGLGYQPCNNSGDHPVTCSILFRKSLPFPTMHQTKRLFISKVRKLSTSRQMVIRAAEVRCGHGYGIAPAFQPLSLMHLPEKSETQGKSSRTPCKRCGRMISASSWSMWQHYQCLHPKHVSELDVPEAWMEWHEQHQEIKENAAKEIKEPSAKKMKKTKRSSSRSSSPRPPPQSVTNLLIHIGQALATQEWIVPPFLLDCGSVNGGFLTGHIFGFLWCDHSVCSHYPVAQLLGCHIYIRPPNRVSLWMGSSNRIPGFQTIFQKLRNDAKTKYCTF